MLFLLISNSCLYITHTTTIELSCMLHCSPVVIWLLVVFPVAVPVKPHSSALQSPRHRMQSREQGQRELRLESQAQASSTKGWLLTRRT